jgi:mannose-1-phosphate guanylyltransferase / phosphomannomutase
MQTDPAHSFPQTAVILAGGKGTRLGLTDRPKPLVPVDHRSLLEIQIEWLAGQGIRTVFLLLNYMPEKIKDVVGDGSRWGLEIKYEIEDKPLGTSGALAQLKGKIQDDFFVIYGDLFSGFLDLKAMHRFHHDKQSDLTLLTHPNDHPYDSDLVEADRNDQVTRFLTKPHPENLVYFNLVNAAVYVFTVKSLALLEDGKFQDLARDVFPLWLNKIRVFSYKSFEYVKDIGTPDRIEKLRKELAVSKTPQRKALNQPKPCVFWDRDGTLIDYVSDLKSAKDLKLKVGIEAPLKFLNSIGVLNIVVTNQPGIAKGYMTVDDLSEIHKKMDTELGNKRVWVDEVYYCPHHPDKGFAGEVAELKINCDCRKPKTGLFQQAQSAYNIDLSKSIIVGDSHRDRLAAEKLGVGFVAILNGEGKPEDLKPNIFETAYASELTSFFAQYFKQKGIHYDSN